VDPLQLADVTKYCLQHLNIACTTTHTHTLPFYGLCPGLPGWAGTRRGQYQKTSFWILRGVGKIIEASVLTIQLDATPSGPLMPPPPSSPNLCYQSHILPNAFVVVSLLDIVFHKMPLRLPPTLLGDRQFLCHELAVQATAHNAVCTEA